MKRVMNSNLEISFITMKSIRINLTKDIQVVYSETEKTWEERARATESGDADDVHGRSQMCDF
jgi:hypothetical protein